MNIRYTRRAAWDLADIAEFIRSRNPGAAQRVRDTIVDAVQDIAGFPEIGRKQSTPGVRKLVISRFPYLVYYSLDHEADEIAILAIQHAARRRDYEDA